MVDDQIGGGVELLSPAGGDTDDSPIDEGVASRPVGDGGHVHGDDPAATLGESMPDAGAGESPAEGRVGINLAQTNGPPSGSSDGERARARERTKGVVLGHFQDCPAGNRDRDGVTDAVGRRDQDFAG